MTEAGSAGGRLPITLCVGTRNASALLPGCLDSCADWVSETLIVDMASEDDTAAVGARYGARVIAVEPSGIVETVRQTGIDAAAHEWVLILDPDERAEPGLRNLLAEAMRHKDVAAVELCRKNYVFGRWIRHSGYWPDRQIRFFRTRAATWPPYVHTQPVIEGAVLTPDYREGEGIRHMSYNAIAEWIERNNRYTDFEVENANELARRPGPLEAVVYPVRMFIQRYVLARGFRDGVHGLALALLMACYEVMRTLKVMEADGRFAETGNEPPR